MRTLTFLFTFLLMTLSKAVFAQAGNLDNTFGDNGIVTASFSIADDYATSSALQTDGKIVATVFANEFMLVRLNIDGTIDSSFGESGQVATAIGLFSGSSAVAIQPDEKIIAAGNSFNGTGTNFVLVRYNASGALDSSFGTNGIVTTAIGVGFDAANSVAIEDDGKIVASGTSADINGSNVVFALARYNSDGILDSSFGFNGKTTTTIGSGNSLATAAAIQSDGKIVLAGFCYNANADFALVRYNDDGTLDSSFDADGKAITEIGSEDDWAKAMVLQPDGRIVVAGSTTSGSSVAFALVRYNPNGAVDSTFGLNGKVITSISPYYDEANSVAIQSDSKIVAAGISNGEFALIRYNANGSLDEGFGSGGKVTTDISTGMDWAYSVVIQNDRKIVAAGKTFSNSSYDFSAARYLSGFEIGIADFSSPQVSPLIYPNPIQQREIFKYTLTKDEVLDLSLYDVNGKLIRNFFTNETRTAGEHHEELNFGNLVAGNYLLTLSNRPGKVSVKMVKQ